MAKHAEASTCTIRLALHAALELEVVDDGIGLPAGSGGKLQVADRAEAIIKARDAGLG